MISVRHNVHQVIGFTERLGRQQTFAVAKAMTDTMRDARDAMPDQAERDLDEPTPWTKRAFYFKPAQKAHLVAEVGIKNQQSDYLRYQVEGGIRPPKKKALRLPSVVELNRYGNLPTGLIRQLVERAKAGKRATKSQARRFGVSNELDLFYGDPADGRPPGIYKRVSHGSAHQLVPIVVFPQRPAVYRKRFDFYGAAARVVERRFVPNLHRALAHALATAR